MCTNKIELIYIIHIIAVLLTPKSLYTINNSSSMVSNKFKTPHGKSNFSRPHAMKARLTRKSELRRSSYKKSKVFELMSITPH